MADKTPEDIAREILEPFTLEFEDAAVLEKAIAAALVRVREEALEEAAKIAERDAAISKATEANYEPGSDSWWLERSDTMTAKRIAASIRALAAPAPKDVIDV